MAKWLRVGRFKVIIGAYCAILYRMRWLPSAFAFLALATAALRAAPLFQLELQSEPGDYIGQGQTYAYDLSTANFSIISQEDRTGDGLTDYIWFRVWQPPVEGWWIRWDLIFSTDQIGANLQAGYYPDAERGSSDSPLIYIGGTGTLNTSGRGCNTCYGEFTILTPAFSNANSSPSFAITFEQHSESPSNPAMYGTLYYNYNLPEPSTFLCVAPLALALLLRRALCPYRG